MASRLLLSLLFSSANVQQPAQNLIQSLFPTVPPTFPQTAPPSFPPTAPPSIPPSVPPFVPPIPTETIIVDPVPVDPNSFIIPNQNPGFNPQNRNPLSFEFQPSLQPPTQQPEPGKKKLYPVVLLNCKIECVLGKAQCTKRYARGIILLKVVYFAWISS